MKKSWAVLVKSLEKFTDDFMKEGRKQQPVQKKDSKLPVLFLLARSWFKRVTPVGGPPAA